MENNLKNKILLQQIYVSTIMRKFYKIMMNYKRRKSLHKKKNNKKKRQRWYMKKKKPNGISVRPQKYVGQNFSQRNWLTSHWQVSHGVINGVPNNSLVHKNRNQTVLIFFQLIFFTDYWYIKPKSDCNGHL